MAKRKIAIIGLGLIGGSLALALKRARGDDLEIIGFARRPEVAAEAIRRGAVDRAEPQMSRAVANADIVIVATPVLAIKGVFSRIARHLQPNAIVSDVGSTKTQVMQWAKEVLPQTVSFIGGHPMTGKETTGLDEAESGLFEDCAYCLTPSQDASKQATKAMEELVRWIGARPLFIEAEQHDKLVAGISHLPLVLSSALVSTLAQNESWAKMSGLAATGYRDMTRLASGSPELSYGICLTNQEAICNWLDRYIEELKEYRRLIVEGDSGLEELLRESQKIRQKWLEEEGNRFKRP
jgi:prephenate dehydrogenase